MRVYKITTKSGQTLIKDFKNTYSLLKYCDLRFKEDYEAEVYSAEQEQNQRFADVIQENLYYEF
jgi:hypothetical protein